jgi:hypothetical protein
MVGHVASKEEILAFNGRVTKCWVPGDANDFLTALSCLGRSQEEESPLIEVVNITERRQNYFDYRNYKGRRVESL